MLRDAVYGRIEARRRRGCGGSGTRDGPRSTMLDIRYLVASAVSALLLPLLVLQGRRVRRTTPRLPGAAGPSHGRSGDGTSLLRLLVVGESTVAGVGAARHDLALTGQIALALSEILDSTVEWRAVGANGATAACTREELVPVVPAETFDVVVIALGVNDVLRLHSPARWRRDLGRLVDSIRERVGSVPVVVAAMPPIGRFPVLPEPLRSVLGARAAALERATHALAREADRVMVCTGVLENDERHYCEDRFHPSELGYRDWGRLTATEVALALKGSPPATYAEGPRFLSRER